MLVVGGSRRPPADLLGPALTHVPVDLLRLEAPDQLIDGAVAEHGGVDILINNVGGGAIRAGFLLTSEEDWLEALTLNLLVAVRVTRAALPHLLRRRGVIVNISSINGRAPEASIVAIRPPKQLWTH